MEVPSDLTPSLWDILDKKYCQQIWRQYVSRGFEQNLFKQRRRSVVITGTVALHNHQYFSFTIMVTVK